MGHKGGYRDVSKSKRETNGRSMREKDRKPLEGFEPPPYRLLSGCSAN